MHQGGVRLQAKPHGELKKHGSFKQQPRCRGATKAADEAKPSSQRVLQQPVGGARRTPEEQSHQRDDRVVVRGSDGECDRVKSDMSEACA